MRRAQPYNELQFGADEALRFLVSRIAEQARRDGVPLTDQELEQVSFSEDTSSAEQIAAAQGLDSATDISRFEAKITKLLRRAYDADLRDGRQLEWKDHLARLRDKDVYVLVMVDEAKIPRPKPHLRSMAPSFKPFRMLLLIFTAILPLSGFLYFFILPMRQTKGVPSSPHIFDGLVERLALSDSHKAIFFVVWLGSVFVLGRVLKTPK